MYASDVDPDGWIESINQTDREARLRSRLFEVTLGAFTVSELKMVSTLMGVGDHLGLGMIDSELSYLEKKADELGV